MALDPTLTLPGGPQVEDVPQPDNGPGLAELRQSAADLLKQSGFAPRAGAPGGPVPGNTDFLSSLSSDLPGQPPKPKEGMFSGVGKAVASGAAELGHQITGAANWAANRAAPGSAVAGATNWANNVAGQSAQDWRDEMTPQERDLMARQWTSLDPHQTIWQGSPHDFVHALTLQMGQAAPATLSMLLPMTAMARAGMVGGALTYVGATQAGLSLGQISNNIQDEIASRDDNTLRQQSPAYAKMLDSGMDPQAARQQLTQQAQRYAPVVGGLISGAIATLAGRYITPVITGQVGAGILRRAGMGFADQAAQGAGIGAANYIATETAANVYDKGRAPDLMGTLHAAGEAAASQGALGAGFAVAHGRSGPLHPEKTPSLQPAPELHATMANTPENKATGAATEEHTTNMFADETPNTSQWEGEGGAGGEPPPPPAPPPGQIPLDLQHAIQAHYDPDALRGEAGFREQPPYQGAPAPEPQPPAGVNPAEVAIRQDQLPLRGGLRAEEFPRGVPTVPADVNQAQPQQRNLPLEPTMRQRGGMNPPAPVEPARTYADQLRERAAGNQDWNQPDLFRDQGNASTLRLPQNRPTIQGSPDHPSAEPFSDIQGQLNELKAGSRSGVWLSGDTMASLRRSGLLDGVRDQAGDAAVPLVNFDGKGGTLFAKDAATAQELTHYRDAKVGSVPEIIEHATGEQQAAPGPAEVLRRSRLTGLENEVQQRARAEQETGNEVRRATEATIPDRATALRARAAAARDLATGKESPAISAPEAAKRLTAEAQRTHNEITGRAWRGIGAPDPRDVDFHSEDLQRQYEDLDHELAGMRVMRNTARTPEDVAHADAGAEVVERKIARFLDTHDHETRAEQVARAAVRVSPEGVREFVENKRQLGKRLTEPLKRIDTTALEKEPRATRAELHAMHPDDLKPLYEEALDRTAKSDRKLWLSDLYASDELRKAGFKDREATPEEIEKAGHLSVRQSLTKDEMRLADRTTDAGIADEPHRSLMEKRILRYYRTEAGKASLGSVRSDKMAVSPRRALTEREAQKNAGKSRGAARIVGYRTFDPKNLIADVESQKEMEADTAGRKEFRQQRQALKVGIERAVRAGEKSIREFGKLGDDDVDGKISMARGYMRQILQYGRSLRDGAMGSSHSMAAAKQFNAHVEMLSKLAPAKRAQYLIDAYKNELLRQNERAAGANPERREHVVGENPNAETRGGGAGESRLSGDTRPFSAERSTGHQLSLPYGERAQPKFGYTAERPRTEPLSVAEEEELRGLINRTGPKQYKLALRGGQAEPQGTTINVENLSQYHEQDRSALGYPQKPTAFRSAAEAIASRFENGEGGVRASTVIRDVLAHFPADHPMAKLFRALSGAIDERTMIGYGDLEGKRAGVTQFLEPAPVVKINRKLLEMSRAVGANPHFDFLHTIGHELVHVATTRAIERNPHIKAYMQSIFDEVSRHPEAGEWYGARKDLHEMIAEAYSNPKFQRFLDSIRMENQPARTLWQRFKGIVAQILGYHGDSDHYSALDAIMRKHSEIFQGKQYHTTAGALAAQHLEHDADGTHVGNAIDRAMKSAGYVKDLYSNATEHAGQAGLSLMTPRQQSAQFSKYFERAGGDNPYRRYWDTFFKRSSDNALSMEHVGKLSNTWSNLEEKYGIDQAAKLSKIMHDSTIYGFHPDLPAGDAANGHVGGTNVARAAEARTEFSSLPEEMQAHYRTMKQYYADEQRNTTDQIVLNGLHAMLTKGEDAAMSAKEFDSKYDAAAVRRLALDTQDGLQKEFGDKLSGASQDMLAKIGKLSQNKGPYFPLMRNGDYIVTAKRQIANKEFDTSQAAQAYAREQRSNDPTLAVNVTHDAEDGTYRVGVTEREVRMAETKSEAAQHRKELAATYGEENTTPVQLKADLYQGSSSITTGSALDRIIGKLEGNPAAQAAIKDFYLRSLGEQSFRKRELARANVRGVDIQNQHQSFVNYGRSQSYYLSQLKWGRHLANAQGEVNDAVKNHRDESQVSAVRMGEFARELALRDKISQNPYLVDDLVRKGSSLTQFYMLTSPSHWFVRAAQPYMLTAPWLGARHGYGESMAALGKAQRMIASPLLNESVESGLGIKALFSRAAAEKTYSVLDQVMQHINDPKVNAMLQHLRNNNLIDLSMATELADIGKGKSTGLASRVLDAGRTMLHLAEVNNRVMTAIAARELGLKQGMTEAQTWDHAADAINVTHNDYSYGNTPRAFMAQAKGVLGGARPLMFQFMKYPQQVYGMMISSGLAALKGKTPLERQVGLRTLSGVLLTHMLAAGAIGASIQPMKWAIGGLMAGASAMGLTDQKYTVAGALSGDTYDHELREVANDLFGTELGETVSKGLPAAMGIDLSQRMALGSTYQFHLKTDSDASTLGSLMETFGGPWLNVAENFYDSGKSFLNGDIVKGIQGITPHIIRDLVKSGAMASNGVVNNAGTQLIPADKLSGPELFAQALGFRPEKVAEVQDRNNAERTALANVQDQRKTLIQRYVSAEPNDRTAVRQDVMDFSRQHPGFRIDYSTLQKAVVAHQVAQQQMQAYGVRLKGRQLPEIAAQGAPYNVQ